MGIRKWWVVVLCIPVLVGCKPSAAVTAPNTVQPLPRDRSVLNAGDFDRAVAEYTEAIGINPKDAHLYRGRSCVPGEGRTRQRGEIGVRL